MSVISKCILWEQAYCALSLPGYEYNWPSRKPGIRWRRVINSEQWFCATPVCGSKNGKRSRRSTHSRVLKLALYSRFCWYADAFMNRSIFSKFVVFAIWKSIVVADDIFQFAVSRRLFLFTSCVLLFFACAFESFTCTKSAQQRTRKHSMERKSENDNNLLFSHSGSSTGDSCTHTHMRIGWKRHEFDRYHNTELRHSAWHFMEIYF